MQTCSICQTVFEKKHHLSKVCSSECKELLIKQIKERYYSKNKDKALLRNKIAKLNGYKSSYKPPKEKVRENYVRYNNKNKELIRQKARDLAARPERKAYMKEYRLRDGNVQKEKERSKKCYRKNPKIEKNRHLNNKFGIGLEEYGKLLDSQEGVCAICKGKETRKKRISDEPSDLAVDHCHKTGVIRGLLCFKCNSILGRWEDKIEIFKTAIEYLSKEGTLKVPDKKGKLAEFVEFYESGEHLL